MNFRVLVSYASSAADVPVTACSTSGVADLAIALPGADMLVMAWSTLGVRKFTHLPSPPPTCSSWSIQRRELQTSLLPSPLPICPSRPGQRRELQTSPPPP